MDFAPLVAGKVKCCRTHLLGCRSTNSITSL